MIIVGKNTKFFIFNIRTINIVTAIVYIICYRLVYINYLVPYQSYGYPYQVNNNSLFSIWLTNLLTFAPILLYRGKKISEIITLFLYIMVYVPTLISLQYYYKDYNFVIPFQLAFFFAITLFFLASRNKISRQSFKNLRYSISNKGFIWFAVFDILLVVIVYHSRMRLVSFFDVYDLRVEFDENQVGIPGLNYIFMWMASICTLMIAIGCHKNDKRVLTLGFLISLVYYMSNAMKSVLFAAIASYVLYYIIEKGWIKILFPIMIAPLILAYLLVTSIDNEAINMAVSITLSRTYSISAGLIPLYIYTFNLQNYPFTYFSHIGIVNSITGIYPFDAPLGTAVNVIFWGDEAMANTNFLVMDGYSALGIPGIYIIAILVYFLFSYINKVTNRFSFSFVIASMMGAIMEMSNMSIFTTLLSAGLLFLIVYYRFVRVADEPC